MNEFWHSSGPQIENKILNLARKLKNLWNLWVMVIVVEVGVFEMVPKGIKKGLDHLDIRIIETIQTTVLL